MLKKGTEQSFGSQENRNQVLRKTETKEEFLEDKKKTSNLCKRHPFARDLAYSYPAYSSHVFFAWFCAFLTSGEDGFINAR